jgi:TolB-like protein
MLGLVFVDVISTRVHLLDRDSDRLAAAEALRPARSCRSRAGGGRHRRRLGLALITGKPSAIFASSETAPAARSGVPTVAVLPFVNVTGNPQYDTLAQRIGQKTMDAGAAGGAADPIDAGRQLKADYVVTGNLEVGGDALRATFQADDVHSGARLWSRTISPILESVNATAAEDEVAEHAEELLRNAILPSANGRRVPRQVSVDWLRERVRAALALTSRQP